MVQVSFCFFCQLVIFVKLASVLFAVTFFAMLFATMALPAALLCVGPTSSGWAVNLWALVMRAKAGELTLNEIGNAPPPERSRSTKSLSMVAQLPSPNPQGQKLPEQDVSVADTSFGTALLQSSQTVARPSSMVPSDARYESRKTEASRNDSRKTEVFLSTPTLPSASPLLSGRRLPSPATSFAPAPTAEARHESRKTEASRNDSRKTEVFLSTPSLSSASPALSGRRLPSANSVAPAPLGRRCTTPGSPSGSAAQTAGATYWGEQANDTGLQLQPPASPGGFRSLHEWSSKPSLPSPSPTPGNPAASPGRNFASLSRPAVQSYVGGGGTGQLPSWSGAAIAGRMSTAQHGRPTVREAQNRQ